MLAFAWMQMTEKIEELVFCQCCADGFANVDTLLSSNVNAGCTLKPNCPAGYAYLSVSLSAHKMTHDADGN